ncbi:hypothetical protein B9T29_06395 [Acinetobacter sp. ANC 3903]|uniref:hypothetical protein n=1 Tax=Acinetobacter sp. ANC 3903 TaxID=1977883 RepID=UPI000A34F9A7|nr:hypothetical protein [Acinetobacter sp. ANC 3903]OTG62846.1 hypothetical protein B9T29_06395 [Acinetobacter sp. ANC 3903]
MNDFFLATNRSIAVNDIEVRQIQMKDFDTLAAHAEPIKQFLKDKDHSDEILTELFAAHGMQVISTIACVTDLDNQSLFKLASNEQAFKQLLKTVFLVNQAYFKYEKPKHGAIKAQTSEATWFDSFQFLVSMGHQHSEIMEMTYGAFDGYVKAASKMHRQGIINSAVAARVAQADKKGFETFKKDMSSD